MNLATVSAARLPKVSPASSVYVALGDSYASGEGLQSSAATYLSPSNNDGCHRSVTAYPVLVATSLNLNLGQFESYGSGGFVACSGATTKDLLKGENGEPPQLRALSPATRWVTLTAGGDDLHFSNVLVACLDVRASVNVLRATRSFTQSGIVRESKTCDQYLASANALFNASNGTSTEEAALEHLYEQVFVHAPNAELAVLNYPQLFTVRPPAFCPVAGGISLSHLLKVRSAQLEVGYSRGHVTEFNRVQSQLNAAIAGAVSAVSALGADIRLVDVNSLTKASAIPCNVATNGRSDMNTLRFSVGSPLTTILENCHLDLAHLLSQRSFVSCPSYEAALFLQRIVAAQSFHPKQRAHNTMARAVEALVEQVSTTTTTLSANLNSTKPG
ncbi:MAG TPA: SGNH/GDSL hydrolase family protein [Acidimicrobiales bacterium]|nr:SGNH/GDSL hydrolase family protein [Acidimicrobiales bacterium]